MKNLPLVISNEVHESFLTLKFIAYYHGAVYNYKGQYPEKRPGCSSKVMSCSVGSSLFNSNVIESFFPNYVYLFKAFRHHAVLFIWLNAVLKV